RSVTGACLAHLRRPRARVDPRHLAGAAARPSAPDDFGGGTDMRLTVGQAVIRFLAAQYSERDGEERRFFAGCFGIFGHGNVAGIGQALLEHADDFPYYMARNEQAMVHTATGYARMN